ncbi:inner membrane yfiN domain protein [Shigella dysenteriae 1617]|nr:inner membrane yfiN domain protein [Shigella dysenteriae 1617]EFP73579.1 inner membrane yfiN domain protein [Shigella dysenteriae 1617]
MDNDNSLNKRPTFKRALRNISMTSIFITMMLIWLLLSVTSVLTLKQYAQKNLALTAATMTYSLGAAVVFADGPAATETLAALGQQGQFSTAEVRDKQQNILASWHYTHKEPGDTFSNFISHWLFPAPIIQPIRHNGETIGERSRQFNQPFYLVFARRTDRLYSAGIRNRNYPHPPFAQWPGGSTEKYHRCRT